MCDDILLQGCDARGNRIVFRANIRSINQPKLDFQLFLCSRHVQILVPRIIIEEKTKNLHLTILISIFCKIKNTVNYRKLSFMLIHYGHPFSISGHLGEIWFRLNATLIFHSPIYRNISTQSYLKFSSIKQGQKLIQ